jgi:hypothetical protein
MNRRMRARMSGGVGGVRVTRTPTRLMVQLPPQLRLEKPSLMAGSVFKRGGLVSAGACEAAPDALTGGPVADAIKRATPPTV